MAKNCAGMYKRRRTPNWALKMCLKTVITANVDLMMSQYALL